MAESLNEQQTVDLEDDFPEEVALLPVRDTVLFPRAVMPLNIGRESSISLISSLGENKILAVVAQRDPRVESPDPHDLFDIATLAVVHKSVRMPNNSLLIFCEGIARIRVTEYVSQKPYYKVRYKQLKEESAESTPEIEALRQNSVSMFHDIVELSPALSEDALTMVANLTEPGRVADFIAAALPGLASAEKQGVLETLNVQKRMEDVVRFLGKEREVLQLRNKISTQVQDQLSESQREFYLREQMKAIQKELGDSDEHAEIEELRSKIDKAGMPDEVKKEAHRELKRLSHMSPAAADYTVTRTYLDWLVVLPWDKTSGSVVDIVKAKKVLNEDHYDLEKIKDRILDYMAVLQLKPSLKGPILCFVGPPGVGKTSLGKSIARALGREFVRLSLGGVHDEAEIRGHRRTYIGALPGQILQGLRVAATRDPVFMLDEIDKVGRDFRGDPASALLEVLDPEQNSTFRDNYLDLPFDLSKVLFVTTANVMDPVPDALRDRMEVLELQGYTESEKLQIAFQYLIPRQIQENGLATSDIEFRADAVSHLIRGYTREAGVRNLEREIGTICRKHARRIAQARSVAAREAAKKKSGKKKAVRPKKPAMYRVIPKRVEEVLGAPRHRREREVATRTRRPGVSVGLAWTPTGGDVLYIEASMMPGSGKGLLLTGHLGKVMQESMQAALSWVRAHSDRLGIEPAFFKKHDLHLHVPAGAIPKDGPSAGVTVVTALVSLITGRRVKKNFAMTGEATLSGLVLPVGGIKEKVLAAHRAGVTDVVLPAENEIQVKEDLKSEQLAGLRTHYVKTVDDVISIALEPAKAAAAKKKKPAARKPARETTRKAAGQPSPKPSVTVTERSRRPPKRKPKVGR
ncbi:MAG TPA: endopeptidase La [Bryobacterales bacterium]|nr:endopeptidase La [Bryobacterales bacterium]